MQKLAQVDKGLIDKNKYLLTRIPTGPGYPSLPTTPFGPWVVKHFYQILVDIEIILSDISWYWNNLIRY